MRNSLWFIVLATGLILFGCDSSEQPKAAASQQPAKAEEMAKVEDVKVSAPVVEDTKVVIEKVDKEVDQTTKRTETTTDEAGKTTSATIDETVKVTENTVAKEEKQTVAEVAAVKSAVTEPVATAKQATIPHEIVLVASKGNVTLPHSMHADAFECSICHGDGTPATFDLTKEVAHKVCKGCHKDEGVGPTGCSGCHKK